jgi:membrane-associated protein
MEFISQAIDFLIHFDTHLGELIHTMGPYTYLFLFLIIFAETGLVIFPFLPGDSLLFLAGAAAADVATAGAYRLNVVLVFIVIFLGAVLGNIVNYFIGYTFGEKILTHSKIIKQKHLDKTHKAFEKYGIQAIIVSRFVPIVRTIAPFVAGIGKMSRKKFLLYNFVGGFLWSAILVFSGFFLSKVPLVQENFSIVIVLILVISLLPVGIEFLRHKFFKPKK